jgi:hypothetical protein
MKNWNLYKSFRTNSSSRSGSSQRPIPTSNSNFANFNFDLNFEKNKI